MYRVRVCGPCLVHPEPYDKAALEKEFGIHDWIKGVGHVREEYERHAKPS